MRNSQKDTATIFNKRQGESTKFKAQMKTVFNAFYDRPKTMLMVSVETGILRANICRYVAKWRKTNKIDKVKTDRCTITKHEADFLTTNPELFPMSNQLKIFS